MEDTFRRACNPRSRGVEFQAADAFVRTLIMLPYGHPTGAARQFAVTSQQATTADDACTDAGADHQKDDVAAADGSAAPCLAGHKGVAIAVHHDRQPQASGKDC